ncbi:MAG: hypothetical protein JOZ29_17970 [Deltaproteobacteria bacterium]|nr:hypothetical protein [Deltaproteobacteria bacterium]
MPKVNFNIDTQRFCELMADGIETWVEMMPEDMQTKPLVGLATESGQILTPKDLVYAVRSGSELGVKLVEQAISLAGGSLFQQILKPTS